MTLKDYLKESIFDEAPTIPKQEKNYKEIDIDEDDYTKGLERVLDYIDSQIEHFSDMVEEYKKEFPNWKTNSIFLSEINSKQQIVKQYMAVKKKLLKK